MRMTALREGLGAGVDTRFVAREDPPVRIIGEDVMREAGSGQARRAARWLPRVDRLLELGCSTGYLTSHFAGAAQGVVSVDINQRALALARHRDPGRRLVCADLEQLPFRDEAFDAIVMLEVIEHTADDRTALREVTRILRLGGALVLSTPNAGMFAWLDPHNLRKRLARRLPAFARVGARLARFESGQFTDNLEWHRHYTLDELARMLGRRIVVRAVHRGGLVLYPLAAMAISVAGRVSRSRRLLQALFRLLDWDFSVPYGRHAYNLVMLAERVE